MQQQWVFKARPLGRAASAADFELQPCPLPPAPGEGEVTLAPHLFSLDPTMRNAMAGPEHAAAIKQTATYYERMNWQLGEPPVGRMVATVVDVPPGAKLRRGELVVAVGPWSTRFNAPARGLQRCAEGVRPESHLSMLGATGLAALLPITHIAQPRAGQVAFVSAAAGATGLCAAQALKLLGCTVVGCAGSADKCAALERLGIAAFNYRAERPLAALQRLCPNGIDIYFDNVGGEMLEAALEVMRDFGRIIACGSISGYDQPPEERYGVRNLFHVVAKRLTFRGFITDTLSFSAEQFADATRQLSAWLAEGKLQDQYTVLDGFEQLPQALLGLFSGANLGKMIVRVPLISPGSRL